MNARRATAALLALALAGCSGEAPVEAPAPQPFVFDPDPVPEPVAPEPEPVAVAPAPAPVEPAPKPPPPAPVAVAPVAPAPKPAPRPAPAPVTPAPAPAPAPVVPAPRPAPRPAPVAVAIVAEPVPAPKPVAVDPLERCGDPHGIEASAAKGALSNADLACLDEAYALAATTLDKERVSLVTITNAYASDDPIAQEDALHRHLTEVDAGNPEIALRYALLLYSKGGATADIVEWSEVALVHRTGWTRQLYDQRVFSAYKLRAAASQDLLERAIDAQEAVPGDDTDRALVVARDTTRRYAREWYDFARQTGQDYQAALDLCLFASQSVSYCEGT